MNHTTKSTMSMMMTVTVVETLLQLLLWWKKNTGTHWRQREARRRYNCEYVKKSKMNSVAVNLWFNKRKLFAHCSLHFKFIQVFDLLVLFHIERTNSNFYCLTCLLGMIVCRAKKKNYFFWFDSFTSRRGAWSTKYF